MLSYGHILRSSHVLQSVKRRNFEHHVEKRDRPDIEEDIHRLSDTAIHYAIEVRGEYDGLFIGHISCPNPIEMPDERYDLNGETKIPERRRMRRMFTRLVTGDKGPFANVGKARIPRYV